MTKKEEHTHLKEAGATQLQSPNATGNAALSGHFFGQEEPKSKFHVKWPDF